MNVLLMDVQKGSQILFALLIYIIMSWLRSKKTNKKTLKQYKSVTFKICGWFFFISHRQLQRQVCSSFGRIGNTVEEFTERGERLSEAV